MKKIQLIIGDKNLSSWSMRAGVVMNASGILYEEILIPLDFPDSSARIAEFSPSGKVPCLVHGDVRIWDSLAISEYVAELAPRQNLWPEDATWRAIARAYTAEMHSAFSSIRMQLSMDIRLRTQVQHLIPQTISEIKRVLCLWKEGLDRSRGPFLFGDFGIVDAFYAPVVLRFISYGIDISDQKILKYMDRVVGHPAVQKWVQAAAGEVNFRAIF